MLFLIKNSHDNYSSSFSLTKVTKGLQPYQNAAEQVGHEDPNILPQTVRKIRKEANPLRQSKSVIDLKGDLNIMKKVTNYKSTHKQSKVLKQDNHAKQVMTQKNKPKLNFFEPKTQRLSESNVCNLSKRVLQQNSISSQLYSAKPQLASRRISINLNSLTGKNSIDCRKGTDQHSQALK